MGATVTRAYRLIYAAACRRPILRLAPALKPFVKTAIERLAQQLHTGKRLERELAGYLSFRTKRYRVIYRVDEDSRSIEIHYVGHRRDIYEVFADEIRQRKKRD
jgi:mRNA-degrading endonuclease RelE of RelBE toxin-antitoxin system